MVSGAGISIADFAVEARERRQLKEAAAAEMTAAAEEQKEREESEVRSTPVPDGRLRSYAFAKLIFPQDRGTYAEHSVITAQAAAAAVLVARAEAERERKEAVDARAVLEAADQKFKDARIAEDRAKEAKEDEINRGNVEELQPAKAGVLGGVMSLCTACTNEAAADRPQNATFGQKTVQEVTVALDRTPNTNHTGFYIAKALGLYDNVGLDVKLLGANQQGSEGAYHEGQGASTGGGAAAGGVAQPFPTPCGLLAAKKATFAITSPEGKRARVAPRQRDDQTCFIHLHVISLVFDPRLLCRGDRMELTAVRR